MISRFFKAQEEQVVDENNDVVLVKSPLELAVERHDYEIMALQMKLDRLEKLINHIQPPRER